MLVHTHRRAEREETGTQTIPTAQTATLAELLLLQTAPSGSAQMRVVQAQPTPVARPMSSSAPSRSAEAMW